MSIERMDHVGVVVRDLAAARDFFCTLGFNGRGDGSVDGEWVDRVVGLEDVKVDFAMIETPDGRMRLELIQFGAPDVLEGDAAAPANTLGLRHLAFWVDDLEATLASVDASLVGEIGRFGDVRLCYVRGPEGIIVELAQKDAS